MIEYLGVLVMLFIGFLIGDRVGRSVPDEVVPSRRYVTFLMDTLLLSSTALLLFSLGWTVAAVLATVLLVGARAVVPFTQAYAPATGALLAASVLLPVDMIVVQALLILTLSYLAGAFAEQDWRQWVSQPVVAAVALAVIWMPGSL